MNDEEIVLALKTGSPAGARELIDKYGNRLLRSAYLLCQADADAQDIVQETVIQGIKSIQRFEGNSSLYTWLHGILLNKSRHFRRGKVRRKMVFTDRVMDENMDGAQVAITPKMMKEASVLAGALRGLSPAHREVVVLRFFEGMKLEEIANVLGVNSSTVRSRLQHALARLKKNLPENLDEMPF